MSFVKKQRRREAPSGNSLKVLAAQTLKIASINGLGENTKLETELEDEIRWEERKPPREIIGRARRKCAEILHSKKVLLVIIVLNIIDCLLVVGELTLDFHQVTDQVVTWEDHTRDFLTKMKIYNFDAVGDLRDVRDDKVTVLYDRLLASYVVWNASHYTGPLLAADCLPIQRTYNASSTGSGFNILPSLLTFAAEVSQGATKMTPKDHEHLEYEKMAHKLHYCSISILSFLLLETLLKIVSVGRRFLKKKMEMFDAVVVAISFTLDLVFLQGLTAANMRSFVVILSFLLPWRILRILNSLVVALMHQNRFHLKVLYKQKRKITKQFQEASNNVQMLEKQLKVLKNLCNERGILDWEINKALAPVLTENTPRGLKTLGTLVFKAAESFATLSVPKLNDCTASSPTPSGSVRSLGPQAGSRTPPLTASCNGDVRRNAPNGHKTLVEPDQIENETSSSKDPAEIATSRGPPCDVNEQTNGEMVRVEMEGPVNGLVRLNEVTDVDPPDGATVKGITATGRAPDNPANVVSPSNAETQRTCPYNRGVPADPSPHDDGRGCSEKLVGVEMKSTNPGSPAKRGGVQREDDPTEPGPPDAGQRQASEDSAGHSPVPRFYLSSDDSVDTDLTTSVEDPREEDIVFTKL